MAAVLMILPCWQGCEFSSFPADDDGQAPDGYFEDALPDTGGVADSPADPGVPDVPVDTGVPDAPYAPDGPPPAVGDPFQGLGDGIRLMGRIWPMPNPIYIDLTQPEPSAVFVLENIGSEDVLADYMEIIGSPGFVFSDPASAATPHVIHGGGTDCTGAGGTGRGIR